MKNIKKIIGKTVKDFNYKINTSLYKNFREIKISFLKNFKAIQISLFDKFIYIKNLFKFKSKTKVSTFNKALITSIIILFVYLFYLTIPNLYNKTWVQNKIENKLFSEFKMNFSLSSEVSYQILPSPNFIIKNVEIVDDSNNIKTFASIKNLRVFISQNNFFDKEKIEIRKVLINDANFLIDKKNFYFFSKFVNKIFSDKKLKIKKSNIFFKDDTEETLLINKIDQLFLYFDKKKLLNTIELQGETLNIPYNLFFTKDLINKQNKTEIKFDKIKINYKNISNNINKKYEGLNIISFLNSKFRTEYEFKNDILLFESVKSKLTNNNIYYKGELSLDPFDFIVNIDLEKINLKKNLNTNSILLSLIKSGLLFNNNISSNIHLNSNYISDHKLLKNFKANFIIQNGNISFHNSQFLVDKIGLLTIEEGKLSQKNDNIIFDANFKFNIDNSDKFFSFIQTPKNKRKLIKNIYFNVKIDVLNNQLYLTNLKIDDLKANLETENILDNFNLNEDKIDNLILFKNLLNRIVVSYLG